MPLTPTKQNLVTRYLPMARRWAKIYAHRYPHLASDIHSASQFALCQAVENFDPERGVRFSTFARHRIRGGVIDYLRRELKQDNRSVAMSDVSIAREDDGQTAVEDRDQVESLIRRLPRREKIVMTNLYVDGRSQTDTATRMGLHKSRICVLHGRGIRRLLDSA